MNDTRAGGAPGCVTWLGGPLMAFGLWMIAQALLLPHEAETVRLSIITGAFVAGTGAWLIAKRLRSAFPQRAKAPRWNEVVIDDTVSAGPRAGTIGPDGTPTRADAGPSEALAGALGCSLVVLGFLLVGPLLLYFYFSGAPTRRGNPVMGLVMGILFTAVGFLGVLVLGSLRRKSGRKWGRNDPRRLP
jgi:hypothetical protein